MGVYSANYFNKYYTEVKTDITKVVELNTHNY